MAVRQLVFTRVGGSGAFAARSVQRVEVFETPCIVMSPLGPGGCDALVVPANEFLCGTALPYFPVGGPVPRPPPPGLGHTSWGGMEAGQGMLYASQVVDGAVSEGGGHALAKLLASLPTIDAAGRRCAVGDAVRTPSAGDLARSFRHLIHVVPPFRSAAAWGALLARCYARSLDLASDLSPSAFGEDGKGDSAARQLRQRQGRTAGMGATVAVPLLGAGARGAGTREAADVAVAAVSAWRLQELATLSVSASTPSSPAASGPAVSSDASSISGGSPRRPPVVRFGCADGRAAGLLDEALRGSGEWALRSE